MATFDSCGGLLSHESCHGEVEGEGVSRRDKLHLLSPLHESIPCMSAPQLLPGF